MRGALSARSVLVPVALAALLAGRPARATGDVTPHHRLEVRLDPAAHRLVVQDEIVLPPGATLELVLSSALEIRDSSVPLEPAPSTESGRAFSGGQDTDATVRRYRLARVPPDSTLKLTYEGRFDFGLADEAEEYARGFRDTVGIVSEQGVYLAGPSFWVPVLAGQETRLTYDLQVESPAGWHVTSAGQGTSRDEQGRARWSSAVPLEEIHLVGGPLVRYADRAGSVETLVYLHEPDEALAAKYLAATARYLEMYRGLLGEYPYGKFALVENFWETGYGMPSFTLLGPRVIRLPFILTSSYPHEILHNWWGNGVFVDLETGNWCEGLTAYLADHLMQEQQGRGDAYRRDTLQKYRNYVRSGRDFPLVEFRARHSAATEAVGYGKSLMLFHMLRRKAGDDAFRSALRAFFDEHRFHRASFRDLEAAFETATKLELARFFDAWLERAGAPQLAVDSIEVVAGGRPVVRGVLRQVQREPPFPVDVPIVLDGTEGAETRVVSLTAREARFEIPVRGEPLLLRVDPQFDVFRLLDPRETPPSIGQLFGAPRVLAVLPAAEGDEALARYRELVSSWVSNSHSIDVETDRDVERLPDDRSVWIVGRQNRFAAQLFSDAAVPGLEAAGHSLVVVRRHPASAEQAVGWLVADPLAAAPGLARKLPHYGKYSYLGFEGEAAENVAKGQWPTTDSPLTVVPGSGAVRKDAPAPAPLPPRPALVELPPLFSRRALAAHVEYLASAELEGRGIGTAGLERAAAYVAERFAAIGLVPAGDDGTYFQQLTVPDGPAGEPERASNVIGYLRGSNAARSGQSVIVAAHLDHLGFGWPDAHQGDEGRLHPGADDNASGVAVLIELAASFAEAEPPARDLVFVAFTAEERGRLGSRFFVEHPGRFALPGIRGVIDLDTVGRLGAGPLQVLGTGTADEWQHVFRGVSFVTGVESKNVPQPLDSSDHMSFVERGIPAVQVFTGAHADYHRPGDTAERIDAEGLVKVATFVREAVAYLVEREPPLTVTIAGAPAEKPAGNREGRRVSFGTVPEFDFAGPGVKVASLVPGSPAERAGLLAGDVLIRLDGRDVADLRAFSELLRGYEPGRTVQATVLRDGVEQTMSVTLAAR